MKIIKITKAFRHGEICFEVVESIPVGIEKSPSNEFLRGSHGNPHKFYNGNLYLKKEKKDDFVFGYFEANNTTLTHRDHGEGKEIKKAKLPNGFYCLRRQVEYINNELKQIVD